MILKDVRKRIYPPNKDVLDDDDFEKNRTWEQISEINFTYDDKGRKTEYYAPKIHWDTQNRYTWKYDEKGRVIQYNSYSDYQKYWTENYTYTEDGYEISLTWDKDYDSHKEIYKVNSKGRVIEMKYTDKDGITIQRTVTNYDNYGRISRTVVYDQDGKEEVTHIYVYS